MMSHYKYYVFTCLIALLSACNTDNKMPEIPKNKDTKVSEARYTKPTETKSAEIPINQTNNDTPITTYSENVPIATVMPENDIKTIDPNTAATTPSAETKAKTESSVGVDSYHGTLIITIPNVADAAAIQHFIMLNPALTSIIGKDKAASEYFTKGKATINVVAHNENYNIPKKSKFIVGKEYIAKVSADMNVNKNAQQVKFKYSKKYAQINIILSNEERSPKDSLNVRAIDTDGGLLKFQYVIENTADKNYGIWTEYSILDAATIPVAGLSHLSPTASAPYNLVIDPKKHKLLKGQYYAQFVFEKDNIKTKKNIKFRYNGQATICIQVTTRAMLNMIAKEIARLNAEE
jgi:hypothetical protein